MTAEYTTDPPQSPHMCSCGSMIKHHSHDQREVEPARIVVES